MAICFQAMEDERSVRETCLETDVFVQIRESSGAEMTHFTCTTYNCCMNITVLKLNSVLQMNVMSLKVICKVMQRRLLEIHKNDHNKKQKMLLLFSLPV